MPASTSAPSAAPLDANHPTSPPSWVITLLYDGDCPFCVREVNFLHRRDAGRGLIQFVDIASDTYQPAEHGGIDYATAMGRIHGIRADGSIVQNVAVFREVYTALGMGWIYAATRWPVIGPIVDFIYGIWARYRLVLTGRPELATLVAAREQRLQSRSPGCGCAS